MQDIIYLLIFICFIFILFIGNYYLKISTMSLLVFLALNGQASASDEYMDVYLQVGVYTDQIIYFSKDSDTKKQQFGLKIKEIQFRE